MIWKALGKSYGYDQLVLDSPNAIIYIISIIM